MAEASPIPSCGNFQNTGNPVLDSTVNAFTHFVIGRHHSDPAVILKDIHATMLELAAKEPGGLRHVTSTIACK